MREGMYHSRVGMKGQITLPAEIRKQLNIKPRDSVLIGFEKGSLTIKPKPSLKEFFRKIPPLETPCTWEEIEEIAFEEHTEHAATGDI